MPRYASPWAANISLGSGDTLDLMPTKIFTAPPTLAMQPDAIVRELGIRSGDLLLTPPQAAAIMQTTIDQLSTMREVGDGPPFTKLGKGSKAPVRYHLGKLRQWIEGRTFSNTQQAVSRFAGLADLLAKGRIDDVFAVAIDEQGDAFEFWESVDSQRDIVEVAWLTMGDLLDRFRRQAHLRSSELEGDELRTASREPQPGAPHDRRL